jgi:GTPase SAR1 family protein
MTTCQSKSKDVFEWNIAFIGPQRVGKTSFMNTLIGNKTVSEINKDRNTYLPFCLTESDAPVDVSKVKSDIKKINQENLMKFDKDSHSFTITECVLQRFDIPKADFLTMGSKRKYFVRNFWDIPGLDDMTVGHTMLEWLRKESKQFDVIMYVDNVDNWTTTNQKDYPTKSLLISFFENLVKSKNDLDCENKNFYFIPILNKCDDIDRTTSKDAYFRAQTQANTVLKQLYDTHSIAQSNRNEFMLVSSLRPYLTRCVTKHETYHDVDEESLDRMMDQYGHPYRWKKAIDDKTKQELFEEAKDQAEGDKLITMELYGFNTLVKCFETFMNNNETNIVSRQLKKQNIDAMQSLTNDNFDTFIANARSRINYVTDLAEIFGESIITDIHDMLALQYADFRDHEFDTLNEINGKSLKHDEIKEMHKKINSLKTKISQFGELILNLNKETNTLLLNFFNSDQKLCNQLIEKLSHAILFTHEFDPYGPHEENEMEQILVDLKKNNPTLFVKYLKNRFLNKENVSEIKYAYFENPSYLANLIRMLDGTTQDEMNLLWEFLVFKLKLFENKSDAYKTVDVVDYLISFKTYLFRQQYLLVSSSGRVDTCKIYQLLSSLVDKTLSMYVSTNIIPVFSQSIDAVISLESAIINKLFSQEFIVFEKGPETDEQLDIIEDVLEDDDLLETETTKTPVKSKIEIKFENNSMPEEDEPTDIVPKPTGSDADLDDEIIIDDKNEVSIKQKKKKSKSKTQQKSN